MIQKGFWSGLYLIIPGTPRNSISTDSGSCIWEQNYLQSPVILQAIRVMTMHYYDYTNKHKNQQVALQSHIETFCIN